MAETNETLANPSAPQSESMDRSLDVQPYPLAAVIPSIIAFPCNILCGWVIVEPKTVVSTLHCGVITGMHEEPGCVVLPICGLSKRKVSTAKHSMDMPNTKIVDSDGSPIMVSAVVNYTVCNPKKAMFEVADHTEYLAVNASAIVKNVVGKHTYNELKVHTDNVNLDLKKALQPEVDAAGIEILSVSLNELNYAPEIASSMLKKQAAGALIEARKLIVDGAVQIADDAVRQLEGTGHVTLTNEEKVKIVTNLLTVTCGEQNAVPTINV